MNPYMIEQQENFPYLDHWDHVWWAVVNEIVDAYYRQNHRRLQ